MQLGISMGDHSAKFYQTKEDLIEIFIPYLKRTRKQ